MRKFNEICKELDDKEAQKLLEESYNDVVAMRAVLVNKLIENTKKMRENYGFVVDSERQQYMFTRAYATYVAVSTLVVSGATWS